ncbi:MAG: hypothetical protein JNK79_20700 [Chitinophagaceae bacterium]|nr:hypothetical protein [Chitinophagaceae bacterium]
MVTKLTLTMEDSVISSAKKYALKQGKSLSDIVETYLIAITSIDENRGKISPEIRKLMGVIKLPKDFDYKESLRASILKKYGK